MIKKASRRARKEPATKPKVIVYLEARVNGLYGLEYTSLDYTVTDEAGQYICGGGCALRTSPYWIKSGLWGKGIKEFDFELRDGPSPESAKYGKREYGTKKHFMDEMHGIPVFASTMDLHLRPAQLAEIERLLRLPGKETAEICLGDKHALSILR